MPQAGRPKQKHELMPHINKDPKLLMGQAKVKDQLGLEGVKDPVLPGFKDFQGLASSLKDILKALALDKPVGQQQPGIDLDNPGLLLLHLHCLSPQKLANQIYTSSVLLDYNLTTYYVDYRWRST